MIFLIPPSETKQAGGKKTTSKLSFPELSEAREIVGDQLIKLCSNEKVAIRALKLGPTQLFELTNNRNLKTAPLLPAIQRYTGVLYDALKQGLTASQLAKARKLIYIQSALYGLISATDLIPSYRLSADSKLPETSLKSIWRAAHRNLWQRFAKEVVIDLRSRAYAELAPLPTEIESYRVEVFSEDSLGNRKILNHFNKQTKGQLLNALLQSDKPVSLAELQQLAKRAGLVLERDGNQLLLITGR